LPNSLNIALIHAADQGGGAERSVLTLHRTLRALGLHCCLFVGRKHTEEAGVFEIPAVRTVPGLMRLVYWLERRVGWQYLYAPRLRGLVRELDRGFDVVHVHTLWGGQFGYADVGALPGLSRRFPTVLTLRDAWMMTGHCACYFRCDRWQRGCGHCPDLTVQPAIPRDATRFNWRRKRRAIQRSHLRVTAVSDWLKAEIERSPIFAGKPVDVVHNGIDETVFCPGDRAAARAELGIAPNAFVVLMAGQAIEGIRQGIAQQGVEALNRLNDPRITPMLIGHSADRVAATLRIPSVVLPFQRSADQMAQCYRAADITLVTSEFETFGRVAAESICCGTPVVAFATGGLADIVRPGISGWLVPTGDVDGLVAAIETARATAIERPALLENCSTWAVERFGTRGIVEQYLRVYAATIDERKHE
jgi:glycosyltransferase involved in cell wall biosynthesis